VKARDFATGNFRLGLESTMALAQRAGEALLMTGEIEPVEDVVAATHRRHAGRRAAAGAAALQARRLRHGRGRPGRDADRLRGILASN